MAGRIRKQEKMSTRFLFSIFSEGSAFLLFLLLIIGARILGDEKFGVFSFAMAFVNVVGFIADGGLRLVYTRVVARDPSLAEKYLGNILSLVIVFSSVTFVASAIIINLLNEPAEVKLVVYILAGAEILRFVLYVFRYVFRTADRFDLETVLVTSERVLLLVLGVAALLMGYGVIGLTIVFLVIRIFDCIMALVITARTVVRPSLRFDFALWGSLVRQGIPFILFGAVVLLLYRIDSVLLSLLRSHAEVGWYNAAYRLVDGWFFVPLVLSSILYPSFARFYDQRDSLIEYYTRGIKYALAVSIPLTLLGSIAAEDVIILIYGEQYRSAVILLQVLLMVLNFSFIHEIGSHFLAAIDRQMQVFYFSCVALGLNIVLNLIMIPRMGAAGAGIATVIAEAVFAALITIYVTRLGYPLPYLKLILKPLIATAIVGVIAYLFMDSLILLGAFSLVSYVAILTLLSFWDEQEIALFRKAFLRARGFVAR